MAFSIYEVVRVACKAIPERKLCSQGTGLALFGRKVQLYFPLSSRASREMPCSSCVVHKVRVMQVRSRTPELTARQLSSDLLKRHAMDSIRRKLDS